MAVTLLLTSLFHLRRQTLSAWILNSSFHVLTATSIRTVLIGDHGGIAPAAASKKAPDRSLGTAKTVTVRTVLKAPDRSTIRASLRYSASGLRYLLRPGWIERSAPFSPPRRERATRLPIYEESC